jgi:hypothetical protein
VRNAGEDLLPRPRFLSSFFDDGSNHHPPADKAGGMFACFRMRTPRARLSAQSFRTPLEGKKNEKTGDPVPDKEQGRWRMSVHACRLSRRITDIFWRYRDIGKFIHRRGFNIR